MSLAFYHPPQTEEERAARIRKTEEDVFQLFKKLGKLRHVSEEEAREVMTGGGLRGFLVQFQNVEPDVPQEDVELNADDLIEEVTPQPIAAEVAAPELPQETRVKVPEPKRLTWLDRIKQLFTSDQEPDSDPRATFAIMANASRQEQRCSCGKVLTDEAEALPYVLPTLLVVSNAQPYCRPCIETHLGDEFLKLTDPILSRWSTIRRHEKAYYERMERQRKEEEEAGRLAALESARREEEARRARQYTQARNRALERITQEELHKIQASA